MSKQEDEINELMEREQDAFFKEVAREMMTMPDHLTLEEAYEAVLQRLRNS